MCHRNRSGSWELKWYQGERDIHADGWGHGNSRSAPVWSILRSDIIFFTPTQPWDGIYCAMGGGGTQGAGFYETSYSQMRGMNYVLHRHLS